MKKKLLDLSQYENEWVAMVEERVIARGRRADTVYKSAKKLEPKKEIVLAKLPKRDTIII